MKIFRQLIQFSLMAIAFAISSTLASCSSDVDPEDYDAVEKEVSKEELLLEFFFGSGEKSTKDKALISAGLERAKSKKDYDLVKKYFNLFANYDKAGHDQKMVAIVLINYFLGEHQPSYANDILSITTAHPHSKYNLWNLDEKESLKTKIEKEEVTYLISLKSEEAVNRLISKLERPQKKPDIGEECDTREISGQYHSYSPVAQYHHSAKSFNSKLDEYLSIALELQNDIAAKKNISTICRDCKI